MVASSVPIHPSAEVRSGWQCPVWDIPSMRCCLFSATKGLSWVSQESHHGGCNGYQTLSSPMSQILHLASWPRNMPHPISYLSLQLAKDIWDTSLSHPMSHVLVLSPYI